MTNGAMTNSLSTCDSIIHIEFALL